MRPFILLAALAAAIAVPAVAATPAALRLGPGPAIAKDVAAAPRILAGAPQAARTRINTALARADARGKAAAASCRADGGPNAEWTRTVETPFAGPAYLAVVIRDSYFCGGAYPDNGTTALVFDLASGRVVDWTALAPAALQARGVPSTAPDGARLGLLASPRLMEAYGALAPECREAAASDSVGFMLWPDRAQGGLVLGLSGFPHALAPCGEERLLKPEQMRALGFAASVATALVAPMNRE